MPDGTSRFSLEGKKLHHYMGTSTFSNFTVLPEIAVAKNRDDAPFDKVCYIGCGVTTGVGAVLNTAKVEPGAKCVVFGLGGIGLNVIQGLRLAGADMIIGVDVNNGKKEVGRALRDDALRQPERERRQRSGRAYRQYDKAGSRPDRRRRLHLRLHRQCHGDAAGAGVLSSRLGGQSIIIGVAPAGAEIATRPFQLVTGRVWKGTAFGGARGRTDVPKIVEWYMEGKIRSTR